MPLTHTIRNLQAMMMALVLVAGCSTSGSNTLLVKTGEAARSQYLPDEFSRLMESLNYDWVPVTDPDIGHPVKVATVLGEYRMQFRSREADGLRIDLHIRQDGQSAGLHFYQGEDRVLDAAATRRHEELRQRLELEFGSSRVRVNHPLLTP